MTLKNAIEQLMALVKNYYPSVAAPEEVVPFSLPPTAVYGMQSAALSASTRGCRR